MSKTNAKVLITMLIVGVITWLALFIAIFWGGYQTLNTLFGCITLTFINYVLIEEVEADECFKVVFSKEEESN